MFDTLLAQSRTTYEFARLQSYTERWHYLVLAASARRSWPMPCGWYRRDSVELRRGVGCGAVGLRLAALVGLAGLLLESGEADRAQGGAQLARAGAGRHQPEHGPARRDRLGRAGRRPTGWNKSSRCSTTAN